MSLRTMSWLAFLVSVTCLASAPPQTAKSNPDVQPHSAKTADQASEQQKPAVTAASLADVPLDTLESREMKLVTDPPDSMTAAEVDHTLSELRWAIAKKLVDDDIPGAIHYARTSLELQEARPGRWEQLGDLYMLSGDPAAAKEAEVAYDNALFLNPRRRDARVKLASALLIDNQIEPALRHLELALCLPVDQQQQMRVLRVYVTACAIGNQAKRGIAFCQTLAANPQNTPFQVAWAILEKSQGNRDKAVKLLEEVTGKQEVSSEIAAVANDLRRQYTQPEGGAK